MARQAAGAPRHRAMAGWGPVARFPPYRRVRWMLAATHALVRYGAIGNFDAPGAGGEDR
jgi:hypothetical protein